MIDVMIVFIASCIALSASLVACALWWEASKKIDIVIQQLADFTIRKSARFTYGD